MTATPPSSTCHYTQELCQKFNRYNLPRVSQSSKAFWAETRFQQIPVCLKFKNALVEITHRERRYYASLSTHAIGQSSDKTYPCCCFCIIYFNYPVSPAGHSGNKPRLSEMSDFRPIRMYQVCYSFSGNYIGIVATFSFTSMLSA